MNHKAKDDQFTDEEIARRRDEVIKRMASTPPRPHKPPGKPKPKAGASPKKRGLEKKPTEA
jgi:hypothetical protein